MVTGNTRKVTVLKQLYGYWKYKEIQEKSRYLNNCMVTGNTGKVTVLKQLYGYWKYRKSQRYLNNCTIIMENYQKSHGT